VVERRRPRLLRHPRPCDRRRVPWQPDRLDRVRGVDERRLRRRLHEAAGGGGGGGGGVSATSTIQAESYNGQSGTQTEATADAGGGQNVGWIANGDWLQYNNVNFGTGGLHNFNLRLASGAAGGVSGTVEIHLDSLSNPAIGRVSIANTGGWQSWRSVAGSMSTVTGTHTVYLKFVSGQPADFVKRQLVHVQLAPRPSAVTRA